MSDWDEDDDDFTLSEDEPELFEDGWYANARATELSEAIVTAETAASEKIKSLTANQFIHDAYVAAINLRNVCGDADGFVGEMASTIASNLDLVAAEIKNDPAEMVIAAIRAMPLEERQAMMGKILKTLDDYLYDVLIPQVSEAVTQEG